TSNGMCSSSASNQPIANSMSSQNESHVEISYPISQRNSPGLSTFPRRRFASGQHHAALPKAHDRIAPIRSGYPYQFLFTRNLGGHPKPASRGHLKTGQLQT